MSTPGQVRRPMSTPNMSSNDQTAPGMDAGSLISNTMKMQNWISKKQVQDIQATKKDRAMKQDREKSVLENIAVRQLFTPILETEKTLVKDVNEYLQHTDHLELRKKELLHKNWNDRVYEPIRRKILAAMNGDESEDKSRRRRELHHQYLEHVNRKGHVFLDTMDKGEYYAQALYSHRPAPITVSKKGFYHTSTVPLTNFSQPPTAIDKTDIAFIEAKQRGQAHHFLLRKSEEAQRRGKFTPTLPTVESQRCYKEYEEARAQRGYFEDFNPFCENSECVHPFEALKTEEDRKSHSLHVTSRRWSETSVETPLNRYSKYIVQHIGKSHNQCTECFGSPSLLQKRHKKRSVIYASDRSKKCVTFSDDRV